MSANWGSMSEQNTADQNAKRMIRMWGYLAVAGVFITLVAAHLGINLF